MNKESLTATEFSIIEQIIIIIIISFKYIKFLFWDYFKLSFINRNSLVGISEVVLIGDIFHWPAIE